MAQLREIFSRLYRREEECRRALIALWKKELSPAEVAGRLFGDVPVYHEASCFLLMMSRRSRAALELVIGLTAKGSRKWRVDEAEQIFVEEMLGQCERLKASTTVLLANFAKSRKTAA